MKLQTLVFIYILGLYFYLANVFDIKNVYTKLLCFTAFLILTSVVAITI